MKRLILFVMAALVGLFLSSGAVRAAESSVKIESPKDGATVKGPNVMVKFKFVKGGDADHVHLLVDGEFVRPIKSGDSAEAKDLKPGMHEITIQASKANHELIDVKDSVKVKVE